MPWLVYASCIPRLAGSQEGDREARGGERPQDTSLQTLMYVFIFEPEISAQEINI